jgi:hypothetical protein
MNNKTIAIFSFILFNKIYLRKKSAVPFLLFMSNFDDQFRQEIIRSYTFEGDSFRLRTAMFDGHPIVGAQINVPLCTLNRHGLIAGATGTEKTKTLQLFAENLSNKGVPIVLLDIKGDLSGLAESGLINNKIIERYEQLGGKKWSPCHYPVELLTMSDEKGVRLRSTLIEFGPILLSKILGLNETQTSFISLIFKYSDDKHLSILDLKDFIKILQYISDEGKDHSAKDRKHIKKLSENFPISTYYHVDELLTNMSI